jgi:hypothetical protein
MRICNSYVLCGRFFLSHPCLHVLSSLVKKPQARRNKIDKIATDGSARERSTQEFEFTGFE